MKQVSVVIGANYGDEGKGLFTDYLVGNSSFDLASIAVLRFNGGAQAGHTVELKDGTRHVFHHFGAGTLRGAPTILSRFFVVNPKIFLKESFELTSKLKTKIRVFVDPDAVVTTPFEIYLNRELEESRGVTRHGSCGVGFGETLERETQSISLTMYDLASPNLKEKLEKIQNEWLPKRLVQLGLTPVFQLPANTIDTFLEEITEFIKLVDILPDTTAMNLYHHVIFEGAQGLRLDQNSEDFPHVTRSNTGLENVNVLLENYNGKIDVYYISRCYITRHGAGPLSMEITYQTKLVQAVLENDKTNVPNPYQGSIRVGPLDFERLKADVERDKVHLKKEFNTHAVMTWCNIINRELANMFAEQMYSSIGAKSLYMSFSPTAENMIVR